MDQPRQPVPIIPAKTILSPYREGGWFASQYTMNLYRGCCHGCIYCDSRSACYGIEQFDVVRAKDRALALLSRELGSKRRKGVVVNGSMSDGYNPFERTLGLTRGALELLGRHGFGVVVNTKSDLAVRDVDALCKVREHAPAVVNFTVTTADDALCRRIEPHVCPSSARFAAMRRLTEAGVLCGVLLMPILPYLNDTPDNILDIVGQAAASGASWVYAGFGVTLRQNQRAYFFDRLDALFPGCKERYIRRFGSQYLCASPRADELRQVCSEACRSHGLLTDMAAISARITQDYEQPQLRLF